MYVDSIDYQASTFEKFGSGQRRRPKRLIGYVQPGNRVSKRSRRDGSVQPLALYEVGSADGWGSGDVDERLTDTARGHLFAIQFGGDERPGNLVPMWAGVNSTGGAWGRFETELSNWVHARNMRTTVTISIDYPNPMTGDERVPESFTVTASAGAANRTWVIRHFGISWICHGADASTKAYYNKMITEMDALGWKVEGCIDEFIHEFPSYRKIPVFPTIYFDCPSLTRPYAFLDYIDFKAVEGSEAGRRRFVDAVMSKPSTSVDSQIREVVLAANRVLNDGWLITDADDDPAWWDFGGRPVGAPAGTLTDGGRDTSAEIDHIVPSARGGFLAFSNLQVTSGRMNSNKRASIDTDIQAAFDNRRNRRKVRRRF